MKRSTRVLIVDDREIVRSTLQDILLGFDCAFSEAQDGATALKHMSETKFDVIFLDLMLPDLSGIEILREAKRLGTVVGKVIILTGLPEPATQAEATKLGAFRYLKKNPIDWQQIRTAFAEAAPDSVSLPPAVNSEADVGRIVGDTPRPSAEIAMGADPCATSHPRTEERDRILVVDDDSAWLQTIELILGDKYDLELTTQPSEAISLVKSTFPSLAILDQRISADVTGIELLGQLRGIRHDLRAIILTGYAELKDAVESMKKIGVFYYISKGELDLASELRIRVGEALAEKPPEEPLATMIARGESAEIEFKSSARWDMRLNKPNPEIEAVIVKTVAAFLNSGDGGILLIGVDDSGKIVGLQNDYNTLRRQDRDGFENFLTKLLLDDAYGKDVSPFIRINFHNVDGKDVCQISTKPTPRAVFVPDGKGGEHFYIRTGNSTRKLSMKEAIEYCKMRWK